ncbi:MAG: 3-hydroxyacyl-ACP dehydratase FabZ [Nitrospirota bacterium]
MRLLVIPNNLIHMLPHSYPFVFVDKILEFEEDRRIVCLKNVTINEEFFQGHFRDNPVMPGVLIIEAMTQASGLLLSGKQPKMAYLSRVKDARFKKPVLPGDQLIITSSIIHNFPPQYVFDVVVIVRDEVVSIAEIVLTVM